MPNDAILLGLDQIKFTWPTFHHFRAYLVGIAADNLGNIQITEYPGKHLVKHRPAAGKPHVWDFGFDGYMIYNKTGGLPDIVAYSLLIVRDRGQERRAGEAIARVMEQHQGALTALKAIAAGSAPAAIALGVLVPALQIVASVLADMQDKVLDTMQGTKKFSPAEKQKDEISDHTTGAICTADFQFSMFDASEDEGFVDITSAKRELEKNRLLLSV